MILGEMRIVSSEIFLIVFLIIHMLLRDIHKVRPQELISFIPFLASPLHPHILALYRQKLTEASAFVKTLPLLISKILFRCPLQAKYFILQDGTVANNVNQVP